MLRGIRLWSDNQYELAGWVNRIRARHGDDLRLVVWDDTGYDLPWELLLLPGDAAAGLAGGPLGAVIAVARWTTVRDLSQGGLPAETGDCHGRVLGYLHQDMADDGRVFTSYAHRLHRRMTPFLSDLDTQDDRTGLVYLGCHGTYGEAVPGLTLGDRTWAELNGESMSVLRRDGSLVCLNACDSGRFVDNRAQGEEALRGFAELFLRKGAGGCIVSSGKVGDLEARAMARRLVREVAEHPRRPVVRTLRDFRVRALEEFGSLAELPRVRNDDGQVDVVGQKRVLRLLYAFMFHYYGHPGTALRLTAVDALGTEGRRPVSAAGRPSGQPLLIEPVVAWPRQAEAGATTSSPSICAAPYPLRTAHRPSGPTPRRSSPSPSPWTAPRTWTAPPWANRTSSCTASAAPTVPRDSGSPRARTSAPLRCG